MTKAPNSILPVSTPAKQHLTGIREEKSSTANSDIRSVWQLMTLSKDNITELSVGLGLMFVSAGATMASAIFLGQLVEIIAGRRNESLNIAIAWFLGLESATILLGYWARAMMAKSTNNIARQVRRALFAKVTRLPMLYFDQQPLGRTITRLTSDVEGIEQFFGGTLTRLMRSLIMIVAVMGALLATDVRFGLIVVAASMPCLIFTFATRGPVRIWLRQHKRAGAFVNTRFAEFLNGLAVIKAFGLEEWTQKLFIQATDERYEAGIKVMRFNSLVRPTVITLCALPMLLTLYFGGKMVAVGTLTLGVFVTFVRLTERMLSPIRAISQEIQTVQESLASSERVWQMLEAEEESQTLGADGSGKGRIVGAVEYDNVSMSYDQSRYILRDVSFTVTPGMRVALVGATGSGKTTTMSLLPRLYNHSKGHIRIDGVPIEKWQRHALRSQIGMVSQDVVIFRGTLRENLLAAYEGEILSDLVLLRFAAQTGLGQILHHFKDGLDTDILEGGENLSMGERQLIALTRMLIRNPSIMILDEATANIDEKSEELVQQAVDVVLKGRTCFIIAHRLSTVIAADMILVFDHGRIVERGTHKELMGIAGGVYQGLASKQLSGNA